LKIAPVNEVVFSAGRRTKLERSVRVKTNAWLCFFLKQPAVLNFSGSAARQRFSSPRSLARLDWEFILATGLFLFPLASFWHNLIYIGATVTGYFIFFVPPAVLGAALGKILRHGFRKK